MDRKLEYLKLPIIIDIGSGEIKAGFSGEEKPKVTFNNYFGEPKYKKIIRTFDNESKEKTEQYIGEDCDKYLGLIKLRYPVIHGPGIFFASQPLLSLFSTSATSGTVLESGEGVTQSCVVYEGYSIPSSYERYNYGGKDVTEFLRDLLKKKGYHFYNSTELKIINEIKENLCYLEINKRNNSYKKTINIKNSPYYLPDGSNISIGEERILAPELLFNPEYTGKEYLGFTDMIISSINRIDIELKKSSYENIWLSGGNTSFKELDGKLVNELKNKLGKDYRINIFENEKINPKYRCWVGGNIISTMEVFKTMWITRYEWNEKGSRIIHIKTL